MQILDILIDENMMEEPKFMMSCIVITKHYKKGEIGRSFMMRNENGSNWIGMSWDDVPKEGLIYPKAQWFDP